MNSNMINKKTWKEFRDTGLLWFINTILHAFGWSIVIEYENGEITDCYPARVKFRGFNEERNTKGYKQISDYMKQEADNLVSEAYDE